MNSEPEYLDYYSDDPEIVETKSTSKYSKFLKYLALGSAVLLGTTSAANITLNSNSRAEFGRPTHCRIIEQAVFLVAIEH